MTDVVNPKSASPDQLLPYHKKISAEGKALMKCFISYTYMVLKDARRFSHLTFHIIMILFLQLLAHPLGLFNHGKIPVKLYFL